MVEEPQEDPRVANEICGIGFIGPTGIEWICIKKPHDILYFRRKGDENHRRGDPIYSSNPGVDRHYMVNRWPNRKKVDYGS